MLELICYFNPQLLHQKDFKFWVLMLGRLFSYMSLCQRIVKIFYRILTNISHQDELCKCYNWVKVSRQFCSLKVKMRTEPPGCALSLCGWCWRPELPYLDQTPLFGEVAFFSAQLKKKETLEWNPELSQLEFCLFLSYFKMKQEFAFDL